MCAGTVNISSGQATSLRDIVLTIGRLLDRPDLIQLGAIPARANDAPLVVGDNTRLRHEVGWTQSFELETGLRDTDRLVAGPQWGRSAMSDVCVLGTGMAGYGAAHRLREAGMRPILFDKRPHYGGHTASFGFEGQVHLR